MATRRKKGPWSELGTREREAVAVEKSEAELRRALDAVGPAVAHARSLLRPDWSRDSKDEIISVHNPLKAAIEKGFLTQNTSGADLLRLPEYNDADHPHSRARALAIRHSELLVEAETVRRALAKATYGDSDSVQQALDAIDGGTASVGMSERRSPALRLWKYNRITGLWNVERTVTPETADQWLAVFQRDEPNETFVVSKNKPSRAPTVKENKMAASKKTEEFKEILEKGVIIIAGENDGYIDPYADEVHVGIVFNVQGYGPHVGAIYALQNRLSRPEAAREEALQEAHEILEDWERDHYPMSEEDEEHRTETYDGRSWTLPALEFVEAIEGTKAEQFIDVLEEEDDDQEDDEESDEDEE